MQFRHHVGNMPMRFLYCGPNLSFYAYTRTHTHIQTQQHKIHSHTQSKHIIACPIYIYIYIGPVGWGHRIHQLDLCSAVRLPIASVLDMTVNNLIVSFQ